MAKTLTLTLTLTLLSTLLLLSTTTTATDPELTTDFSIPDGADESKLDGVFFTYTGLRGGAPATTTGLGRKSVSVKDFPALNGMGVSLELLEFAPNSGNKPDEEMIDRLIETGNSEQIFQNAIQEMGRGQVLDTLEEIQVRHDAVIEIEKKLLDLHQVYLDMAVLVEAQGDLLDNIETQVTSAVDHIQSGTDALRTAKSLQKKSRKCMMIAILILLIIAIIIVLSILKPWKK